VREREKARECVPAVEQLRADVAEFSKGFPCIGFDESTMKFK